MSPTHKPSATTNSVDADLEEQRRLATRMRAAYEDEFGNGIDQDDAARLAELVLKRIDK